MKSGQDFEQENDDEFLAIRGHSDKHGRKKLSSSLLWIGSFAGRYAPQSHMEHEHTHKETLSHLKRQAQVGS